MSVKKINKFKFAAIAVFYIHRLYFTSPLFLSSGLFLCNIFPKENIGQKNKSTVRCPYPFLNILQLHTLSSVRYFMMQEANKIGERRGAVAPN